MIPGRPGPVVDAAATLPDPVIVAFAVITQLADVWFLFGALAVAYWLGERGVLPRRHVVFMLGVALAALAVVETLKPLFGLPRPAGATAVPEAGILPEAVRPLYHWMAVGDGFGFPSGHATAAAGVYGAAAAVGDYRSREWRVGAAGVVVAAVALSRVVLGVHFLVDVVAGVVVGAGILLLVGYAGRWGERPGRAFSVAALVALAPPVLAFSPDTMGVLGAALGARLTWGVVGAAVLDRSPDRGEAVLAAAIGVPTAGGLFGVTQAVEVSAPFAFVGNALALAVLLATPLVARRVAGWRAG